MSDAAAARGRRSDRRPSDPLISARACQEFPRCGREIVVLRGSRSDVAAGEEIAIVGQSGVGKSTLLHILGSLERPSSGQGALRGPDLFALDERALAEFRNRKLGFVFQFHYLLADFSALENVMMPALIARDAGSRGARARRARCCEWSGSRDKAASAPGRTLRRRAAARRGRAGGGAAAAAGAGGRADRQPRPANRRRGPRAVSSAQSRARLDAGGRDA